MAPPQHFRLDSTVAEAVEVALVDPRSLQEIDSIELPHVGGPVFSATVDDLASDTLYGFRVHGPYDPSRNLFCHPDILLFDPRSTELSGALDLTFARLRTPSTDGVGFGDPQGTSAKSSYLSKLPRASSFDWRRDCSPNHSDGERIIYEAHVRGVTALMDGIPSHQRGTYLGVGSEAFLNHLTAMGVTTLELLPIFSFMDEIPLQQRGQKNFWGYNTLSYFAPEPRYADPLSPLSLHDQVREMIRRCHEASIEVVLDVVYNHTAEGDLRGPTLSYRGIDNPSYYLTLEESPGYYNWSGTGNTLNLRSGIGLSLVMDSLRHWVTEYHVDGFRFDLGAALSQDRALGVEHVPPSVADLFVALVQDPLLSSKVLICEPWDATLEGQSLGQFPFPIREWNGHYRDDVRRFWSFDRSSFGLAAQRFSGSSELFDWGGRTPGASVNFITCHDGFTISDLCRFREKNNVANGWDNQDGSNHEVTVKVEDAVVSENPDELEKVVRRCVRAMFGFLFLSLGTPMVLYGDEYLRTQDGNNNAYCQDNHLTYTNYKGMDLTSELGALSKLRRSFGLGHQQRWYSPRSTPVEDGFAPFLDDIEFFKADGGIFTNGEWEASPSPSLTIVLSDAEKSGRILVIVANPSNESCVVTLPMVQGERSLVRAYQAEPTSDDITSECVGDSITLQAKDLVVLLGE